MKILVTAVGTTGDVVPFAALAARLRQRGHSVRACSFALHEDRFAGCGVEFRAIGADVTWSEIRDVARRAVGAPPLKQFELLQEFHLRSAKEHYEGCREAAAGCDLAVCHVFHTLGQAAVPSLDIPWIAGILDPGLLPSGLAPPQGMPSLGRTGNRLLWRVVERSLARFDRRLREVLAGIGCSQCDLRMFRTKSDRLNLIAASPVLCPPREDWPDTVETTGAWFDSDGTAGLDGELRSFLERNPDPVVVTLGSFVGADLAGVTRCVLDALARSGVSAVIQRGAADLELERTPPGVHVVDWAPYHLLFRRASLVVHHAGAGTSHEACRAGVPSVTIPQLGDQFAWATRLHRLAVAPKPIALSRLSVNRLVAAIAAGRRRRSRNAAEALARRIRSEDGLERAIARIERVGGRR